MAFLHGTYLFDYILCFCLIYIPFYTFKVILFLKFDMRWEVLLRFWRFSGVIYLWLKTWKFLRTHLVFGTGYFKQERNWSYDLGYHHCTMFGLTLLFLCILLLPIFKFNSREELVLHICNSMRLWRVFKKTKLFFVILVSTPSDGLCRRESDFNANYQLPFKYTRKFINFLLYYENIFVRSI